MSGVRPWSDFDTPNLGAWDAAQVGYAPDGRHASHGRSTIFADEEEHAEHVAFMDWLRECRILYWDMAGADLELVKTEWRKSR